MADVMVSYARPDLPRAEVLARRLVAEGFDVWFDRDIPPGQDFDRVIDAALRASRAVVVLWSRNSVGSRWVVSEAAEAASKGKLVPARLDDAVVPLEFRRVQTADLIGWNGQPDHPGYRSLVASLRSGPASVVMTTGDVMPPARPAAATPTRRRSHPVMRLLVVAALVIAGLVYWNNRGDGNGGDGSTDPSTGSTTETPDTPGPTDTPPQAAQPLDFLDRVAGEWQLDSWTEAAGPITLYIEALNGTMTIAGSDTADSGQAVWRLDIQEVAEPTSPQPAIQCGGQTTLDGSIEGVPGGGTNISADWTPDLQSVNGDEDLIWLTFCGWATLGGRAPFSVTLNGADTEIATRMEMTNDYGTLRWSR